MITVNRRLSVAGPFDLARSAAFSFGPKPQEAFDGRYRMSFCLDGYRTSAGVTVTQPSAGSLELDLTCSAEADVDIAVQQVARILSVDVDARPFVAIAEESAVLAPLVAAAPGLRPPQFSSAYEALSWAVLSSRRPRNQMIALREQLARVAGQRFLLADSESYAFPTPAALLQITEFPGVPAEKLRRLHGVARAAIEGTLDTAHLRGLPSSEAVARARGLEGIGPFYAELLVVRALGHTDVLPVNEPKVRERLAGLLRHPEPVTPAQFERIADGWRPWRTWACVYIRAVDPTGAATDHPPSAVPSPPQHAAADVSPDVAAA
jgi:DNA-3-methyladenine glycosylase II